MKNRDPFAEARTAAKHPKIHSQEWRDFQAVYDPDPDVEKFRAMLKETKERRTPKKLVRVKRVPAAPK